MSDQKLTLDLGDLAVESIEVVPAASLDSATYGHGMSELAASCTDDDSSDEDPNSDCGSCLFMPDESDGV